jgi:rhamnopyranosyl-N-acetylglucosaminyl-diphospho-decaprenol beta-1,3/1,4-galactofuranosyltransferase
MYKIACNIVTYNRKDLLKRCLDAVINQTLKPITVYIIDNASTDGTIESVKEWGYYNSIVNGIRFKYLLNNKNEGSSGGQYLGIKTAYEEGEYDGIWVMDDDGVPDKDCLMNLCPYLEKYHYVAPIVLSDEDFHSCSFAPHYEDVNEFAQIKGAKDGMIKRWASPFNGVLYSHELISKIGYPKRDMFIWGDENNYHHRAQRANYISYTILNAIHYHPLNRQEYGSYLGTIIVTNITADWKLYCYLRNFIYNELRVIDTFPRNIYVAIRTSISVIAYYHKKGKPLSLLLSAVFAGVAGHFGGLKKYMK